MAHSIASAPEQPGVTITVERLADGEVSPYLTEELRPGDGLELRGPIGGWFSWDSREGGPLLLVAGGSGIVPLMAMLRHRAAWRSPVPVRLLYSSRSADDIVYRAELERLADGDWQGGYLSFYVERVLDFEAYPAGNFSRHHLWFIVYLFTYVLLLLPLMAWWRRAKPALVAGHWLWVLGLPLGINEALLKPLYPESHSLWNDWYTFNHYLLLTFYGFVLASATSCMAFVALFLRFVTAQRPILDRLSENAYAIYVVHYGFVVWLQYSLLQLATSAIAKAAIVFTGSVLMSWAVAAALRRIPLGSRAVRMEHGRVSVRAPVPGTRLPERGGGEPPVSS